MEERKRKPRARKSQPTIAKAKIASQEFPWQIDFRDQFRMRGVREISNDALNYLADLMLQWINHSEELYDIKILLFYQNLTTSNMKDFQLKCPKLDSAVSATYQKIAYNRERNALAKDPSGIAFKHMQGVYDPVWKTQEQYFNDQRAKVAANTKPQNYNISIPTVDQLESKSNDSKFERGGENTSKEVHPETVPDPDSTSS